MTENTDAKPGLNQENSDYRIPEITNVDVANYKKLFPQYAEIIEQRFDVLNELRDTEIYLSGVSPEVRGLILDPDGFFKNQLEQKNGLETGLPIEDLRVKVKDYLGRTDLKKWESVTTKNMALHKLKGLCGDIQYIQASTSFEGRKNNYVGFSDSQNEDNIFRVEIGQERFLDCEIRRELSLCLLDLDDEKNQERFGLTCQNVTGLTGKFQDYYFGDDWGLRSYRDEYKEQNTYSIKRVKELLENQQVAVNMINQVKEAIWNGKFGLLETEEEFNHSLYESGRGPSVSEYQTTNQFFMPDLGIKCKPIIQNFIKQIQFLTQVIKDPKLRLLLAHEFEKEYLILLKIIEKPVDLYAESIDIKAGQRFVEENYNSDPRMSMTPKGLMKYCQENELIKASDRRALYVALRSKLESKLIFVDDDSHEAGFLVPGGQLEGKNVQSEMSSDEASIKTRAQAADEFIRARGIVLNTDRITNDIGRNIKQIISGDFDKSEMQKWWAEIEKYEQLIIEKSLEAEIGKLLTPWREIIAEYYKSESLRGQQIFIQNTLENFLHQTYGALWFLAINKVKPNVMEPVPGSRDPLYHQRKEGWAFWQNPHDERLTNFFKRRIIKSDAVQNLEIVSAKNKPKELNYRSDLEFRLINRFQVSGIDIGMVCLVKDPIFREVPYSLRIWVAEQEDMYRALNQKFDSEQKPQDFEYLVKKFEFYQRFLQQVAVQMVEKTDETELSKAEIQLKIEKYGDQMVSLFPEKPREPIVQTVKPPVEIRSIPAAEPFNDLLRLKDPLAQITTFNKEKKTVPQEIEEVFQAAYGQAVEIEDPDKKVEMMKKVSKFTPSKENRTLYKQLIIRIVLNQVDQGFLTEIVGEQTLRDSIAKKLDDYMKGEFWTNFETEILTIPERVEKIMDELLK
jgi:hypothetical protein